MRNLLPDVVDRLPRADPAPQFDEDEAPEVVAEVLLGLAVASRETIEVHLVELFKDKQLGPLGGQKYTHGVGKCRSPGQIPWRSR